MKCSYYYDDRNYPSGSKWNYKELCDAIIGKVIPIIDTNVSSDNYIIGEALINRFDMFNSSIGVCDIDFKIINLKSNYENRYISYIRGPIFQTENPQSCVHLSVEFTHIYRQ